MSFAIEEVRKTWPVRGVLARKIPVQCDRAYGASARQSSTARYVVIFHRFIGREMERPTLVRENCSGVIHGFCKTLSDTVLAQSSKQVGLDARRSRGPSPSQLHAKIE